MQHTFYLDCQDFIVLQSDGKLLLTLESVDEVDKVIITFQGKKQLLGIPEIPTSRTGQAMDVLPCYREVGISNKIQTFCCDKRGNNRGQVNGDCTNFEYCLIVICCTFHVVITFFSFEEPEQI
ncbi:hypothetical protein R5R35_011331 [Gryllus longicercus]|uniref:Uncharacterized protein n=1 Tax=Gryllus longicercus TaxID=2509291 RepID=A0AAN9WAA2_9ORTH